MAERKRTFHPSDGKRRILLVEDEIINQEILKVILGDIYDIVVAGTGAEAMAEVREHYDILSLILLDLNLPDMHGLDVL
ncbi:MAG: response regulator, partial [Clostridia bacterium]|nr:response regulator [Clostridia bacterium]